MGGEEAPEEIPFDAYFKYLSEEIYKLNAFIYKKYPRLGADKKFGEILCL